MTPEIWVAIGAVFLGLAAVAGGLAMSAVRGPWDAVAIGARVAALAALIVALVASAIVQGQWTGAEPQQAMLSLVVAMLAVHLVLAWRQGAGSAGPMVDIRFRAEPRERVRYRGRCPLADLCPADPLCFKRIGFSSRWAEAVCWLLVALA